MPSCKKYKTLTRYNSVANSKFATHDFNNTFKKVRDCHIPLNPDKNSVYKNNMHYRCMAKKLEQEEKWDCKSQNFNNAHKTCVDNGFKFYPRE